VRHDFVRFHSVLLTLSGMNQIDAAPTDQNPANRRLIQAVSISRPA
jgi:hypothetical protein